MNYLKLYPYVAAAELEENVRIIDDGKHGPLKQLDSLENFITTSRMAELTGILDMSNTIKRVQV